MQHRLNRFNTPTVVPQASGGPWWDALATAAKAWHPSSGYQMAAATAPHEATFACHPTVAFQGKCAANLQPATAVSFGPTPQRLAEPSAAAAAAAPMAAS